MLKTLKEINNSELKLIDLEASKSATLDTSNLESLKIGTFIEHFEKAYDNSL